MKNTPENKAKFFALYWGQEVLIREGSSHIACVGSEISIMGFISDNKFHLELKPLSQITDEDAVEVAKMWYRLSRNHRVNEGKDVARAITDFSESVTTISKTIKVVDYLRSKGYALSYLGVSVEQQIEWNWIKLKTSDQ